YPQATLLLIHVEAAWREPGAGARATIRGVPYKHNATTLAHSHSLTDSGGGSGLACSCYLITSLTKIQEGNSPSARVHPFTYAVHTRLQPHCPDGYCRSDSDKVALPEHVLRSLWWDRQGSARASLAVVTPRRDRRARLQGAGIGAGHRMIGDWQNAAR